MLSKSRFLWAAAVSLGLAQFGMAQEPHKLSGPIMNAHAAPVSNQAVADSIANRLKVGGRLEGYRIDINFEAGTALISGEVASEDQRDMALSIVRGTPGVDRVLNQLTVQPVIKQIQYPPAPRTFEPPATGGADSLPPTIPPPTKVPGGSVGGAMPEPRPTFQAPVPTSAAMYPPKMPPYAWPTYAPYNNYSRVGYPTAYPYKSWPYIGPFYPFPKVPLGWRSVKLEWDDGYWWFSRTATKYDFWKVRFW